ncbi:sorting nexin-9, partial [Trichonephila clavipes]
AKVLYDFEAQPESGELSIWTGELVTITNQDIGGGWWEGRNSNGDHGLFPSSYVEFVQTREMPDSLSQVILDMLDWRQIWGSGSEGRVLTVQRQSCDTLAMGGRARDGDSFLKRSIFKSIRIVT